MFCAIGSPPSPLRKLTHIHTNISISLLSRLPFHIILCVWISDANTTLEWIKNRTHRGRGSCGGWDTKNFLLSRVLSIFFLSLFCAFLFLFSNENVYFSFVFFVLSCFEQEFFFFIFVVVFWWWWKIFFILFWRWKLIVLKLFLRNWWDWLECEKFFVWRFWWQMKVDNWEYLMKLMEIIDV